MTSQNKINNNENLVSREVNNERVVLPLPPIAQGTDQEFEKEVYNRFMSHLRHVPNSRLEIKILSSIQFTADMMDCGDALIAKTLVDIGLKAPRKAFPLSFLDFVDKSLARRAWDVGSASASILQLNDHWVKIGENKFENSIRARYAVYGETVYSTV
jgi:hypothetical protein